MAAHTPAPAFHDAAAYLSSARAPPSVPTPTKLELYGLFKLVTTGAAAPTAPRPGFFDMAGRAKWDAWAAAGRAHAPEQAEARYLEIARGLGWVPGTAPEAVPAAPSASGSGSREAGEEGSDGEGEEREGSRGGGTGMGVAVSKLAQDDVVEKHTSELHALAVADDAFALLALLDGAPGLDVDARDEFGYTALHLAADRGCAGAVRALLARGADKTLKDEDEFTARELAAVAGHGAVVALLDAPASAQAN